jgi:hypothetical protein
MMSDAVLDRVVSAPDSGVLIFLRRHMETNWSRVCLLHGDPTLPGQRKRNSEINHSNTLHCNETPFRAKSLCTGITSPFTQEFKNLKRTA